MTRYTKIAAAAAAVLLAAPVFAAMTTDANLELDSDYSNLGRGAAQGGRVEFNVAGKAGDAATGFVAGRGTLLIKKDGTAATDDMWGQIGMGMVDVKLGRFEATDMFPPGKDTLVEGGADTNEGFRNRLRGRMGSNVFHGALTVNPGAGLSFELGIVETKTVSQRKGIRPVVSFAAGPVTVKAAIESGKNPVTGVKFSGFAATVGGAFEGVGFNVNVGSGKDKTVGGDTKNTSFGANATFGPAGVGLINDTSKVGGVKSKDMVVYAAYSIPLFATGATLTPAVSHQTGKVGSVKRDGATSVRVRMNYAF